MNRSCAGPSAPRTRVIVSTLLIVLGPLLVWPAAVFVVWWLGPPSRIDVLVHDQTVPDETYLEHASLGLLLVYEKVAFETDRSFIGAAPGGAPYGDWPEVARDPVMLVDAHGVYVDDSGAVSEEGTSRLTGRFDEVDDSRSFRAGGGLGGRARSLVAIERSSDRRGSPPRFRSNRHLRSHRVVRGHRRRSGHRGRCVSDRRRSCDPGRERIVPPLTPPDRIRRAVYLAADASENAVEFPLRRMAGSPTVMRSLPQSFESSSSPGPSPRLSTGWWGEAESQLTASSE